LIFRLFVQCRHQAAIAQQGGQHMAERVTGPYRGYYISAAARLVPGHETRTGHAETPIYVGSVSLAQGGPDDAHRFEALVDLGGEARFATEDEALAHVEAAARAYVDRLLDGV
jgi:hypothetical protein